MLIEGWLDVRMDQFFVSHLQPMTCQCFETYNQRPTSTGILEHMPGCAMFAGLTLTSLSALIHGLHTTNQTLLLAHSASRPQQKNYRAVRVCTSYTPFGTGNTFLGGMTCLKYL
jgi:hypothetical protein